MAALYWPSIPINEGQLNKVCEGVFGGISNREESLKFIAIIFLIHPCGVGDWQQVLEPTLIERGPFLGTVCRVGASEAPKVSTGTPPG